MAENTKIEWANHTFNPWFGCQKVGPGCDHCYAEGWATAGNRAFGTVKGEVRHIRSDGSFWGDDLPEDENADVLTVVKVGKAAAGRLLGGVQHDGYPKGGAA